MELRDDIDDVIVGGCGIGGGGGCSSGGGGGGACDGRGGCPSGGTGGGGTLESLADSDTVGGGGG